MKKTRFFSILCLSIIIFATSCKDGEQPIDGGTPTSSAIDGYLYNADGTPIASATVEVTDFEGNLCYTEITKQNGNFVMESIPQNAENSIVSFVKDNKVIQQLSLNELLKITSSVSKKAEVFLGGDYDDTASVIFKITDKVTGEPISGAAIKVYISDKSKFEEITNEQGIATFSNLVPTALYQMTITKNGYLGILNDYLRPCAISPDVNGRLPLELISIAPPDTCTNNTIIALLHPNYNGTPFINRKIKIIGVGENDYIDSATTGDWNRGVLAAKVKFEGLRSGIYKVIFEGEAGDLERAEKEVQVSGNKVENITLYTSPIKKLCSNNVLTINLKDENGNAINCGIATIRSDYGLNKEAVVSNGKAVFTGITKGEHTIYLMVECDDKLYDYGIKNNQIAGIYVKFDCNDNITMTQALKDMNIDCCANFISGTLYKAPYSALANREIKITGPNGYTNSGFTDENGVIVFNSLCPGSYKVIFESDDYKTMEENIKLNCFNAGQFTFLAVPK